MKFESLGKVWKPLFYLVLDLPWPMALAQVRHSALPSGSWCCSIAFCPVLFFRLLQGFPSFWFCSFYAVSPSFGWSSFWPCSMSICTQEYLWVSLSCHPLYVAKELHLFWDYKLNDGVLEAKCLAYFVIPDFIQTCHIRNFSEIHHLEDQKARFIFFLQSPSFSPI